MKSSMPVKGIDHIHVHTHDIAASAAFFMEVLDLKLRTIPLSIGRTGSWL